MKRYRFRFASVLKYRGRILERIEREFAELQRKLLTEFSRLDFLEKSRAETIRNMQDRQASGMTIQDLRLYDAFLERIDFEVQHQREVLKECNHEVETKRQELLIASQKKKALEKLREYEEKEYRERERHLETLQNDELTLIKIARNRCTGRIHERDGENRIRSREVL